MEKTITVAGKDIVAKTLTAEQIADVLEKLDGTRKLTLAEMLMSSEIPIDAVVVSTGLPVEWFAGPVTPDEIHAVWEAVTEANSFLSEMLHRLSAVAGLLAQPGQNA